MTNEQNAPAYEALCWIARHGCENYVKPHECRKDPARSRSAQYAADAWCDACVALEAIEAMIAAAPKPAASVGGSVDDVIALLEEMQTDRTVLLHFSDTAQARIRNGLADLVGYLSGLETVAHRITGDEGEDDALVALQRYAEEREQRDVAALVDRLKRNDPVDDAAIKAATDALVAFLGQPELQVCMRESAQRSWGMRHAIAAALPLLLPEAALTHPGHKPDTREGMYLAAEFQRGCLVQVGPKPVDGKLYAFAQDAELWALHLKGPDDIHAAPSRDAAERVAKALNEHFADDEIKPHAAVIPWTWSADEHFWNVKSWAEEWGALALIQQNPTAAPVSPVASKVIAALTHPGHKHAGVTEVAAKMRAKAAEYYDQDGCGGLYYAMLRFAGDLEEIATPGHKHAQEGAAQEGGS